MFLTHRAGGVIVVSLDRARKIPFRSDIRGRARGRVQHEFRSETAPR